MLFNKKLILGLANIMGVLIILNTILNVVMYVWAFFGNAPFPMFDVHQGLVSYYGFMFKISGFVFIYVLIAALVAMVKGSKLPEGFRK